MNLQTRKVLPLIKKMLKRLFFVLKALLSSRSSSYEFSINDISLYLKEKSTIMPNASVKLNDETNTKIVRIRDSIIHFPVHIEHTDLPWLWHEIFDSFSNNPSSYDHPVIRYNTLKWVIDAGAAEGYYSLFCSKRVNECTKIIAIEPLAIMKNSLEQTFKSNMMENAIAVTSAIGDKDTEIIFEQDQIHICDSKVLETRSQTSNAEERAIATVQCQTLDTLIETYSLQENGLIKMDIEGYEMSALKGAHMLLRNYKPFLAIAVYHDYKNALKCAEIIRTANPAYCIQFRGYYAYFRPPRPYMLFAY